MLKVKSVAFKLGTVFAALALYLGTISIMPACAAWFYQPEVPEGMKKLRRS
jgi:cyclic lactone autoinducer peptide